MGNKTGAYWGIGVLLVSGCSGSTVFSKPSFLASSASTTTSPTAVPSSSPHPSASPSPSPSASLSPSPTPSPSSSIVINNGSVATCGSNNPISAASFYPCNTYFNMPITNQPLDPQSAAMTTALQNNGGWGGTPGNPGLFKITGMGGGSGSGIDVYYTNDPVTPPTSIPVDISGYGATNDPIPTIPVPSGGVAKGFESGDLTCANGNGGDCHYTVMDIANLREVDAWVSTISSGIFYSGGGTVVWPFSPPTGGWYQTGRGTGCTSADATGLPISPLLFSVEELASGQINHAIRFILNNNEMTYLGFVWPGTHTTRAAGVSYTPGMPYGAYLRLRPDYPVSSLPCGANGCGAQVIAKALQTYGMILADGGHITLTAKSATYSSLSYANYFDSSFDNDLSVLKTSDFQVVVPPGVPTAMPVAPPASFTGAGQSNGQFYTTPVSIVASNPTIVPDLTCYRNENYSYLNNTSILNPPSATATEWSSSVSSCSNVTNLTGWLDCQLANWNN